ncbi:MAG: hypothetical protein M1840_005786, partial [Geoglossum simile]
MTSLSDESRATISEYPIGRGLSVFLEHYSEFVSKSSSRRSCEEIAGSVITDKGAERLIRKLLITLQGLDAAEELPPYRGSSHKSLLNDIWAFYGRFPERVNSEAIAVLLKHAITEPVDEEALW